MGKWKNWAFAVLMGALFVEILILFPKQVEIPKKDIYEPPPKKTKLDKNGKIVEVEETKEEKEKKEKEAKLMPRPEGHQKMEGVHLVETQKGSTDWELFAEKAVALEGAGSWKLQKVKVQYYNSGRIEFVVHGDSGMIDGKTRNMLIQGHVLTESSNGYRFETDSVDYKAGLRQITSPGDIKMKGPTDASGASFSLTGQGLLASIDESDMQIKNQVVAKRGMAEDKLLTVQSTSAKFSGRDREAQFLNQVRINYNSMSITGKEASFVYNPKTQFLNSIRVRHNVEVKDQDKQASSDQLEIDLEKDIYRFTGQPFVRQNEDELRGKEILFIEGGQKVKVLNVKARMENK